MNDDQGAIHYTERMVPEEAHARIFWEHVARYRFAKEFVRGKRVLDIACGEGYGAAGLAKAGARSVVGIDVSADVCDHARRKYGLDARAGDAQAIPLPDRSIDLVVSFETIEHVDQPGCLPRRMCPRPRPGRDAHRLDSEPACVQRRREKEPVPSARVRRAGVHRAAPLAVQSRSALHPVPPIGGLVESQVAGSRAIPVASHHGASGGYRPGSVPRSELTSVRRSARRADEIILARDTIPLVALQSLHRPAACAEPAASSLTSSSRWPRASTTWDHFPWRGPVPAFPTPGERS